MARFGDSRLGEDRLGSESTSSTDDGTSEESSTESTARLGGSRLGESRLGTDSETSGDGEIEDDYGDGFQFDQELAWDDDSIFPLDVITDITLTLNDLDRLANVNFTYEGCCDAEVGYDVVNYNEETGEIDIELTVEYVDCEGCGSSNDGTITGSVGGSGFASSPTIGGGYIDGDGDGGGGGGSVNNSGPSGGGSGGNNNSGYDWDISEISVSGASCVPADSTATVRLECISDRPVYEMEAELVYDDTVLTFGSVTPAPDDEYFTNEYGEQVKSVNYFDNVTITNPEAGRIRIEADDPDGISSVQQGGTYGTTHSSLIGQVTFDISGTTGDTSALRYDETMTLFYNNFGTDIGPVEFSDGQINVQNGVNISSEEIFYGNEFTGDASVNAAESVSEYWLTVSYNPEILELKNVADGDIPGVEYSVDTVYRTKEILDNNGNVIDTEEVIDENHLQLHASTDTAVQDPVLANWTFEAIEPRVGGDNKIGIVEKTLHDGTGAEIPAPCESEGTILIKNNVESINRDDSQIEIEEPNIISWPIKINRTFRIFNLDPTELKNIIVEADSKTNEVEVTENWERIPYSDDGTVSAVNATITVYKADQQEYPVNLTVNLSFEWGTMVEKTYTKTMGAGSDTSIRPGASMSQGVIVGQPQRILFKTKRYVPNSRFADEQ